MLVILENPVIVVHRHRSVPVLPFTPPDPNHTPPAASSLMAERSYATKSFFLCQRHTSFTRGLYNAGMEEDAGCEGENP